MNKPGSNAEVFSEMFGLLFGKGFGILVESWLKRIGKKPLDVTMVSFEQNVISPPLFVNYIDELAVGGWGHFVEVKFYIRHVDELADRCGSARFVNQRNRLDISNRCIFLGLFWSFLDGFFLWVSLILWFRVSDIEFAHFQRNKSVQYQIQSTGWFEFASLNNRLLWKCQFLYASSDLQAKVFFYI